MARGMLRGAAASWLGLVVLQAVVSKNGANSVGGLLGTVNGLVKRALDPAVPAIPDHSHGDPTKLPDRTPTVGPDGKPDGGAISGSGGYLPPTDATIPQPNPIPVTPDAYIPWPTVPGTTTA